MSAGPLIFRLRPDIQAAERRLAALPVSDTPLFDNMDLEALAREAAARSRWTGSPRQGGRRRPCRTVGKRAFSASTTSSRTYNAGHDGW